MPSDPWCRRVVGDLAYTSSPAGVADGVVGVIPVSSAGRAR
jgi:hypothetical protein